LTIKLEDLTWKEAETAFNKTQTAILPVGAVEAHGYHMPLGSDNVIATKLAEILAEEIGGILLPLLPFGQVWSNRDFPGSLSLTARTLERIIIDIGHSLHRNGIKVYVILNSHLGNSASLKQAARELMETLDIKTVILTYPGIKELTKGIIESESAHSSYIHGCEIETSLLLAMDKGKVKMERAVREYPSFPPYFDAVPTSWRKVTKSGVLGDPTLATQEKGEMLIKGLIENMVRILRSLKEEEMDDEQA